MSKYKQRQDNDNLVSKLKKWYRENKSIRRAIKEYVYALDKSEYMQDRMWEEIVR